MKLPYKALAGLAVALVMLLCVEFVLRLAVPRKALLFSWEHPEGFFTFVDQAGPENRFRHAVAWARPNMKDVRGDHNEPLRYQTNSMGFREDKEIPHRKPAGTYRVLALGDSWIYGFSVTQGKTIPDHMERLLPPVLGVKKVEVINAAVTGSSAFDMLHRWESVAKLYEVDAVLLGRPHNGIRQIEAHPDRERWYKSLLGAPYIDVRLYLVARKLLAPLTHNQEQWTKSNNEIETMAEDLLRLVKSARARGYPVWMILSPNPDYEQRLLPAAERDQRDHNNNREFVEALRPAGVLFSGHALLERDCWALQDVTHPSASGALSLAQGMVKVIASGKSQTRLAKKPPCLPRYQVAPPLK